MTTSSSDRPAASGSRFIPREELQGFAAWRPGSFGHPSPAAAASDGERAASHEAAVTAARQDGYQAGYRDGLVALESFKQSFAQQMSAQIGRLVEAFDAEFDALEARIAASVGRSATALARQVVRSELQTRPELVAAVAAEAVHAVLMSARHIRVLVHPDDQALVAQGAAEALAARGARLVTDAAIARGGCRVESDIGAVDARIETLWAQAVAQLGEPSPFIITPDIKGPAA
ncbi:MAG TPA: FliH/SctL family protein [Burkholderiaceae bacterium]|nr:FliH/SctL family protein [Burkholderiaceae bacterium]